MDTQQLYEKISQLEKKVSELESLNTILIEREKHYAGEINQGVRGFNFNYTLGVLKNLRRYILEKRERYLTGLVEIQHFLLTFDNLGQISYKVLEIIGQCSGSTRVYLYENSLNSQGEILGKLKYYWHNQLSNELDYRPREKIEYNQVFRNWFNELNKGEIIAVKYENIPENEKDFFADINIQKILLLPLIIEGNFWGFLGLENEGKNLDWENSEIAILESIVGAISLVLQREKAQSKLKNLNQELEQRVQERTAELEHKNRELEQEIKKHEQTMKEFKQAKEQLEVILDAVPASISWISSDLHYLGVNKQLAEQVKLSPEDFINKSVGELKSHYEFMSYLTNFFESDLDKSKAEFTIKNNDEETTILMIAKKYNQGSAAVVIGIDISDRRQAEEALIKSASLNQGILNAMPDSMFYLTFNGTVLRCKISNPEELSFSHYELLGKNIIQFLSPEITTKFLKAISRTIKTEETQLIEFQLMNNQGKMIDWEVRLAPSHEFKIVAIWRNITEEKQAQLALKLSEEKFRATFEQAAVGIAHVDSTGRWLWVNEKLCQITGYSKEELLKIDFQSITYPDDLEMDLNYFNQALKGEISSYSMEKRYLHKQGFPVWVNLTVSLVNNYQNQSQYFIAVIEDISSRKKTEEALRESSSHLKMALDAANMGTWEWNLVNEQFNWSTQSQNLLGRQNKNFPFTYQEFLNCIHPEDLFHIEQSITHSLENKCAYSVEYRIIKPEGSIHWIASKGDVFTDSQGHPLSIIGIDMDITKRKNIEEEMRKALLKEKELNHLKSNFITMTSHEFRTPLSTILGATELLEHYGDNWHQQKKQKYLSKIIGTVQHLTNMLDDLLLIGKSESGGFDFQPIPLNLSKFCEHLVQEFNFSEKPRLKLKMIPANYGEKIYYFDPKLLRHILGNLLSNALKYSNNEVHFNLFYQESKVIFSIQDQGIGIDSDDQKQIFESFHRGKNVGKIPGSGLGLAIVKKAIELHGGEIKIQSNLNQGTTVIVTIYLNPNYQELN